MAIRVVLLLLGLLLTACSASGPVTPSEAELGGVARIWPGANEAVDAEPVLQWDAFPEASNYRITVTDVETDRVVFFGTTAQPTMPVIPALPEGQEYHWTVVALNADGEPLGEVSSFFRVKGGLNAIWPPNGEAVDGRPILQWEPFLGAEQYQVIVVVDDAYPPVVAFEQSSAETLIEVLPELPAGSFSWTVRALAADDTILSELNSQFYVKASMEVIEPASGAVVTSNTVLEWQALPDATSYQVIVLDDDAYPPVGVVDETTANTKLVIPTPLDSGSYSWSVWAKDAAGRVMAELNSQFVVSE